MRRGLQIQAEDERPRSEVDMSSGVLSPNSRHWANLAFVAFTLAITTIVPIDIAFCAARVWLK